jgi:hypothetical protein
MSRERKDVMSEASTPAEPQQLRDEIEQTRADLGETVQALAAKTDVKARAKEKLAMAKGQAAQAAGEVRDQTARAAGVVAETAASAKEQIAQGQVPPRMRRPLPWAAAGTAFVLAGLVIYLIRRRRS